MNIRFGPSLSGLVLREPTLIAQAAATLDELTGGRAEVVLGSGDFGPLAQYHIDWARTKPLSRVKEGVHVMRTLLEQGAITFDGEFFKTRTGHMARVSTSSASASSGNARGAPTSGTSTPSSPTGRSGR